MNDYFTFSPATLGYALAGVVGFLSTLIFVGRWYYKKQTEARLSGKITKKKYASPIVGRNKYPEVDTFKASGAFLKIGILTSLLITVMAMNLTTFEEIVEIPDDALVLTEVFEVEPPRTSEPPPPPPPPPPPVIEEVPNEEFLEEDEVEFVDQSIDERTEVVYEPPVVAEKNDAPPPPPPPPPPPAEVEVEEIFKIVEEMPRFPGCEDSMDKEAQKKCSTTKMLQFIYKNIQYPSVARENGIDGTVVIQFVVDAQGAIKNARIVRDVGGQCGAEALRVVNLMNKEVGPWIPGKQRGKKVKVQFNLPVKFKLESA